MNLSTLRILWMQPAQPQEYWIRTKRFDGKMQNVDQTIDDQESECHSEWFVRPMSNESFHTGNPTNAASATIKAADRNKEIWQNAEQTNDKWVSEIKMYGRGLDRWQIRGDKLSEFFHTAANAAIKATNLTKFRANQLQLGVKKECQSFYPYSKHLWIARFSTKSWKTPKTKKDCVLKIICLHILWNPNEDARTL